jgi:hypothetical protein
MPRLKYIFLFLFPLHFWAQTPADTLAPALNNIAPETIVPADTKKEVPLPKPAAYGSSKSKKGSIDLSKPTIGVGSGMLSFYGDVQGNKLQLPFTSRLAAELFVNYRITKSLLFDFYVMFGRMGANERSGIRNENFLSEIRLVGFRFNYDFSRFLNSKAVLKPYITTGIEAFEFLSKTDLFDKNSSSYFYWKDGSIRNLPEGTPSSNNAQIIKRDYVYESDIRELNRDKFGKYRESSLAVPLGLGVSLDIGPRAKLKFASVMHLSFTDLIDGITEKSIGTRAGKKGNDHFMLNSVSLFYDIGKTVLPEEENDAFISQEELYALDNADADGDGVQDEIDSCHGTPKGVPVDAKGCPLDDDKDNVSNYRDKELATLAGAPVDSIGVTISDPEFQTWYDKYSDTSDIKYKLVDLDTGIVRTKMLIAGYKPRKKAYVVQINNYKNGIPAGDLPKLLGIPDLKTFNNPDSSVDVNVGVFDTPEEARAAAERLKKQGFPNAKAGSGEDGRFNKELTAAELAEAIKKQDAIKGSKKGNKDKFYVDTNLVVYRVQLGAYKKQLSTSFFKNTGNIVAVVTEEGLYKYLSGSYKTLVDAATYRADMVLEGYTDAFIAAYKNGRRIPLRAAGAISSQDSTGAIKEELDESVNTGSAVDRNEITFRIQIGIFKNEALGEAATANRGLQTIKKSSTTGGLVRFTAGEFKTYQEAVAYKNELSGQGYSDAFVISFFKNEVIPLTEALELLKQ